MAVVAAVLGVTALIGGLCTYTGIKIFSDSPSKDHVTTIVKNEIAAHIDADNTHENFQNNILSVIVAAVVFGIAIYALRYVINGIRAIRRFNANNNNENNNNNAINIDV